MEKVHATTLIYRRYLDFNIQPQNQVFNTHELWKPSNLHPSVVFGVFSPTWRYVMVVFAYVHHINQIADQKEKTEGAKGKLPSSHGEIEERMGAVRPLGTTTVRQKEGGRWRSQLAHGFHPMRSTTAANTPPHLSLLIAPLSSPTRSSGIRGQIRRIHLELLLSGTGFLPRPRSSDQWSQPHPSSSRRAMVAGGTRQNERRDVGVRREEVGIRRVDGDLLVDDHGYPA
jgi:hypothetical protein